MKKFKLSFFKEYFQQLFEFQGHYIFDIEHSVQRYQERVGKDLFFYNKLLKKGILWIIKNGKENVEDRYIFRSKRYGFGIQVHWRQDATGNLPGYHVYTSTTFSDDEMKFYKYADKELFLENLIKQGYSKEDSKTMIEKGYARYQFKEEIQKEMDLCNFDTFIEQGKIYYTFEIIEI